MEHTSIVESFENFSRSNTTTMSQFRAKKLDLAGFVNIRIIRDHTKR